MAIKMPTLTIRNVNTEVRDHLRKQAAQHGHSMEAEVRQILVHDLRQSQTKPGIVARRIHKRFATLGGADDLALPDTVPLAEPIIFEK